MKLIKSLSFNGYPVLSEHGELVENILNGNEEVLAQACGKHKRVAVMRFELKFPAGYTGNVEIISKFFDSLRYRLKNDLSKKSESRGRTVKSDLGYVWVKEVSGLHGWHYHVAVFLNYDVYNYFGIINSSNMNMYNRILFSWAGALGFSVDRTRGLVHIPKNPVYKLDRSSMTLNEDIHRVLYRLSYLAKLATKPYGVSSGGRYFGTSSRKKIKGWQLS
jgi:hypothetical protein